MIGKNVVIAVLLAVLILAVGLIGCGSDADEPSAEELLGTWELVVPDDETIQLVEVVFADDSSMRWKARVEGQEDGLAFNIDLAIEGTYAVSGSTLTLVHKYTETDVEFEATTEAAREELDSHAEGLAEQYAEELEVWSGTWHLVGDILILTNDEGAEIVFKKKSRR